MWYRVQSLKSFLRAGGVEEHCSFTLEHNRLGEEDIKKAGGSRPPAESVLRAEARFLTLRVAASTHDEGRIVRSYARSKGKKENLDSPKETQRKAKNRVCWAYETKIPHCRELENVSCSK